MSGEIPGPRAREVAAFVVAQRRGLVAGSERPVGFTPLGIIPKPSPERVFHRLTTTSSPVEPSSEIKLPPGTPPAGAELGAQRDGGPVRRRIPEADPASRARTGAIDPVTDATGQTGAEQTAVRRRTEGVPVVAAFGEGATAANAEDSGGENRKPRVEEGSKAPEADAAAGGDKNGNGGNKRPTARHDHEAGGPHGNDDESGGDPADSTRGPQTLEERLEALMDLEIAQDPRARWVSGFDGPVWFVPRDRDEDPDESLRRNVARFRKLRTNESGPVIPDLGLTQEEVDFLTKGEKPVVQEVIIDAYRKIAESDKKET